MNDSTQLAASPGRAIRVTIMRKLVNQLPPSIWTASSSSLGTSSRKERIIHTISGKVMSW
jgi:hypothetical protein